MNGEIQTMVNGLAKGLAKFHSEMVHSGSAWGRDYQRAIQMNDAATIDRLNRELVSELRNQIARKG